MKKIMSGILALAAFTFSASAQVSDKNQQDNKDWKEHRGFHNRGMENLNLSDAQKQQMKSINEDFRNRMESLNKNDNMSVKDFRSQRESLMKERKDKISSILTPEQKAQFEKQDQMGGNGEFRGGKDFGDRGERGGRGFGERDGGIDRLKTDLGLSDDQVTKIKASNETFFQKAKAIRENQSLSPDQKKEQFLSLQKEREENLKTFLTADQQSKLKEMKGNWKDKQKDKEGKEKRKIKSV